MYAKRGVVSLPKPGPLSLRIHKKPIEEMEGGESPDPDHEEDPSALVVGLEAPTLRLRLQPACLDGTGAVVAGRDPL
jgi:hypothetical protein